MKDLDVLERRAQELIDESDDPLEVALLAVQAIDSHAAQMLVMARLLVAHPELKEEVDALKAEVASAQHRVNTREWTDV